MPDQLEPAPQLRSWTRQGIDVSELLAASINAIAAADRARIAAVAAQAAADQAIAALNSVSSSGAGTGGGLITPGSISGATQIGKDIMVAPGATYQQQQQAVRDIIGAPKVGTAAADAAPGTLAAAVTQLANRVTSLENAGVGGVVKDNIDIDTDGVPIWND